MATPGKVSKYGGWPIVRNKAECGKVSGRGGWKQTHYLFGEQRTLNKRELTAYEQYCEYCEQVIGCKPAADWFWYIETSKLPSV